MACPPPTPFADFSFFVQHRFAANNHVQGHNHQQDDDHHHHHQEGDNDNDEPRGEPNFKNLLGHRRLHRPVDPRCFPPVLRQQGLQLP